MRKNIYNRLFIIFIFLTFICSLSGCRYKGYSGEHPNLYTIAINSLLWNQGISTETERFCDPEINILEKDDYGRILFEYTEKFYTQHVAFSSLLIMQTSTNSDVYYYEDFNFICKEKVSHSNVKVNFDLKDINLLKENNDWNKEVDIKKCVKKEIIRQKPKLLDSDYQTIEEKAIKYLNIKEERHFSSIDLLTSNENLDVIVYGLLADKIDDNGYFVAYCHTGNNSIIDVEFLILKDLYNYQTELKEFKAKNNWYRKE